MVQLQHQVEFPENSCIAVNDFGKSGGISSQLQYGIGPSVTEFGNNSVANGTVLASISESILGKRLFSPSFQFAAFGVKIVTILTETIANAQKIPGSSLLD